VDIGAYEFESEDAPTMLVINEVDAVTTGDDSEFVELKNTGDYPLQLADHALVIYDGSDDASCYSTNLQPELQPGQLFVLGDTTVVEGAAS
jgi:uncharacterized phage-like protein YoqJ